MSSSFSISKASTSSIGAAKPPPLPRTGTTIAQPAKPDPQKNSAAILAVLNQARNGASMESMEADRNFRAAYDQVAVDLSSGGSTTTATGLPQDCVSELERLGLVFVAPAHAWEGDVAASQRTVYEIKDGPELHEALEMMSVNPPRRAEVDADEVNEPPPEFGDSDVDEAPPPPELSPSGLKLMEAMTGYFRGISATGDLGAAEIKLAQYVDRLLNTIQKDGEPSDKAELLSRLGECLNALAEGLKDTPTWTLASKKVDMALEAASPEAVQFRKQTEKSLKVFAGYLDPANTFYNPEVFSGNTKSQLKVLLARIQKHDIESERNKMLVNFAGELCVIAQSANANKPEHADQRLQLVTFLATELGPAAGRIAPTTPRNLQNKAALMLMVAPHQAEVLARKQIAYAMDATFSQKDGRVDKCIELAKFIGASPLSTAAKNACLAEMDQKYLALVAAADPRGAAKLIVHFEYVDAMHSIQNNIANDKSWAEPAAYQALTDAVNKINAAEQAKAKVFGK